VSVLQRTLRLAVPLLLVLAACGGGGGGSSGPTAPPPPTPGIVFTPASAGASGITLTAATAPNTSTLLLEVRANSVTDLYGVAFDLKYPNTVLRYVGATQGTFLPGATFQAVEGPAGTLVVGLSKLGTTAGTSGSGVLMTLQFQSVAAGTGAFTFTNNQAIDSTFTNLTGLSWSAGTATVTL
jgi:hypothetical protein